MEKLTNEEIARVFAMYGICQTKTANHRLLYCGHAADFLSAVVWKPSVGSMWCNWDEIVLPLTPLSSISDEHAIEVARLNGYYQKRFTGEFMGWEAHDMERIGKKILENDIEKISGMSHQYLIQQGYAVPLFFGVGHWANGKRAIELGIAIESPTP